LAALIVLFMLCFLVGLIFPLRLALGWVELFSTAPINSTRAAKHVIALAECEKRGRTGWSGTPNTGERMRQTHRFAGIAAFPTSG
jgi:hypothetical protein